HRIVDETGRRIERLTGCRDDDARAWLEVGKCRPSGEQQPLKVGLKHPSHLICAQVREAVDVVLVPRVEYEGVESAESLSRIRHGFDSEIFVAKITRDAETGAASFSNEAQ